MYRVAAVLRNFECLIWWIRLQPVKPNKVFYFMEITPELVKQIFDYHPDGYLTWKIKFAKRIEIGRRVGRPENREGGARNMFKIKTKHYYCSRLIFLWHNGYLPPIVDHRDRNKLNDKIENLRAATPSENSRNTPIRKNSTSKYLGVYLGQGKNLQI
jgi:hypothetical protein